jgi:hypothetical protein
VDHATAESIDRSIVSAEDGFRAIEIDDASSLSRQMQATVPRCAQKSLHVGFQFLLVEKQGKGQFHGQ